MGFVLLVNARCFRVKQPREKSENKSGTPCFLLAKQGIQDAALKPDGGNQGEMKNLN